MSKRNIALLNYIVGVATTFILVVTFVTLGNTDSISWLDKTSGTSSIALSGIAFVFSFVLMVIVYSIVTIPFANVDGIKRVWLPMILVSLFIGAIIAFEVLVLDYEISNMSDSIIFFILLMISIVVLFILLILFVQELNTKFLLMAIAINRADEWEYSNFVNIIFNKISIKHDNGYTELKHKDKLFIVKFIPENIIERKIFLSGDTKSKEVIELESVLETKGNKGMVVYLSNRLPIIEGTSDKITITTNNELFKLVKEVTNEK